MIKLAVFESKVYEDIVEKKLVGNSVQVLPLEKPNLLNVC